MTMTKLFLYSHTSYSQGGKALANDLGAKRIRHEESKFRGDYTKTVINWGAGYPPHEVMKCKVINHPEAVVKAANKKTFFEFFGHGAGWLPGWTTDKDEAMEWLDIAGEIHPGKGKLTMVCRTVLSGHGGKGIVLASSSADVVDAKLYTKYINKADEYRAHVAFGEVIDVQRKARSHDVPDHKVNWKIRNTAGGFIYAKQGVELPDVAKRIAINCVGQLGLDFGGVDMIWNSHQDKWYILEVNTAPGMKSPTTLANYHTSFSSFLNQGVKK